MGSASAMPARYSTWPIGCLVRTVQDGYAGPGTDVAGDLFANLVSYNKTLNTFEVKLEDGSMRTLPANRVIRARARDRANAQHQTNVPGQMQPLQKAHGHNEIQRKERGASVVTDTTTLDGVSGNDRASTIADATMRFDSAESSRAKHSYLQQQQTPGWPHEIEAMPSNPGVPHPQVLGRVEFID
jgi:hypothetical protein